MTRPHVIRTGILDVNTVIVPLDDKKCFVVDPAACALRGDESKIVDYLRAQNLDCLAILLTHSHFDHIMGIAPVKNAFPDAQIAIHEAEFSELTNPPGPMGRAVLSFFGMQDFLREVSNQPSAERALKDGEDFFGWKVIHTPGHTPGSICLYNQNDGLLISGDTIFERGGYGRTDMAGGNEAQLLLSLELLRKTIPEGTPVYQGHGAPCFSYSRF